MKRYLTIEQLRKRVAKAIQSELEDWCGRGYSPASINTGCCGIFAEKLEELFPKGTALWGNHHPELFPEGFDNDGHCFFALDGFYFDSECPEGASSPHLLPYYQRSIKPIEQNPVRQLEFCLTNKG